MSSAYSYTGSNEATDDAQSMETLDEFGERPGQRRRAVYRQVQTEVAEVLRDCRTWLDIADAEVDRLLARKDA